MQGGLNFRVGDFAAALADFDEVLKGDPKNPTYHLNRGYTLKAQGKPDAAEASYREALRLAPDDPYLLNHLGYFLVEQDKGIAEALRLIERAVAAQPTNPSFLDSLGRAHFKLGHFDESERHLDECVRRDGAAALWQFRRVKYLNNVIEQNHRFIKKKVRASQCFKRFQTVKRTLEGIEAVNMIGKEQVKRLAGGDARGQATFVASLFRVAA